MNAHVEDFIDAYLDGELSPARIQQVETHLLVCLDCLERLENRQNLSLVLTEAPGLMPSKPEARFVAEVELQMQRRGPSVAPKTMAVRLGWMLFPVGLLLAAVFIQAVLILMTVVSIIPEASQVLAAPTGVVSGVPALPDPVSGVLGLAEFSSLPGLGWITLLVILGMIAVLYVVWLVGWFARNQHAAGISNDAV